MKPRLDLKSPPSTLRFIRDEMISRKGIMMVFRHLVGIAQLDYHRLRYIQRLPWLPCPEDEGKGYKELYNPKALASVPYRDIASHRYKIPLNTQVTSRQHKEDEPLYSPNRGGRIIQTRRAIDMMRRVYKKLGLKTDHKQKVLKTWEINRDPTKGIKGLNINCPVVQIIFSAGQITLDESNLEGWVTFYNRNKITLVNLEGLSLPEEINFIGETRGFQMIVHYWNYARKNYGTYDSGYNNPYDYWDTDFDRWEDEGKNWEDERRVYKRKQFRVKGNPLPTNIIRTKNGKIKKTNKQSKILY